MTSSDSDSPKADQDQDLRAIHEAFELLLDGRRQEAVDAFGKGVVHAAEFLLDTDAALSKRGIPDLADPRSSRLQSEIQIDGFEIIAKIGQGSSGEVFVAQERTADRSVALKVLWPCAEERALQQCREAVTLAAIEHPGIARLYRAGVAELGGAFRPWLAMQLVEGGRPLNAEAVATLTVRQRVELLIRVADALAHAHAAGVLHRDLKPTNVLLDARLNPIIIDFGLARLQKSSQDQSVQLLGSRVIGSLGFMAPEGLQGSRRLDARSDVFSLGAIAFEMLTGVPYRDVSGLSLHQALERVTTPGQCRIGLIDKRLVGDLDRIVEKALSQSPQDRYSAAALFAQDLRLHCEGRPVMIERQSFNERLVRAAKRHKVAVVVGGTIAALVFTTSWITFRYSVNATRSARSANLSAGASAVSAADQLVLDRVLNNLPPDATPEIAILHRCAAVRGTLVSDGHWTSLCMVPHVPRLVGNCFRGEQGAVECISVSRNERGRLLWRVPCPGSSTNSLAVSPDGRRVAVSSTTNQVAIIDSEIGNIQTVLSLPGTVGGLCQFLRSGALLRATDLVSILDLDSGVCSEPLSISIGEVRSITELSDDRVVIAGHRGAVVADLATRQVRQVECPDAIQSATCRLGNTDSFVVGGWDRTVRIYSGDMSAPQFVGHGHKATIWTLTSISDRHFASAGADGLILFWNRADGSHTILPASPDVIWGVVNASDGLWIGSLDGLRFLDNETILNWCGSESGLRDLVRSKSWEASIDREGLLRISPHGGQQFIHDAPHTYEALADCEEGDAVVALRSDASITCIESSTGVVRWQSKAASHPTQHEVGEIAGMTCDHRHVIIASRVEGIIRLNIESGVREGVTAFDEQATGVAVARDGVMFVSGRNGLVSRVLPSGRVEKTARVLRGRPTSLALDETQSRLFIGGYDGTLSILDSTTLERLLSLPVATRPIRRIAMDGERLELIDTAGIRCLR